GMSLGAIAQTLGRKTREVARRLPLAKLPKRVKDALASGLITAGHSEYLARIPDAKLQEEALGRFLYDANRDRDGKPIIAAVPLAVAKRIIEEEFMTSLSVAVFDPEDATLSPLGACSKCPHLAGNNPDLFGDVRAKAVCTNPKDFRLKIENHLARLRGSGYTVLLSKNELKHAFPFGESDELGKEFVDLEHMCVDDPKGRPYEELLGRGEKLATVFALKNGRMRKLYPAKEIKSALVASGHAFAKERKPQPGNGKGNGKAFRSEARDERIVAEAVARELAANLRRVKQSPREWTDLLVRIVILSYGGRLERVFRRHGYDGTSEEFATKRERVIAGRLAAMTDAEKRALMIDLLAGDWGSVPVEKPLQALYRELLKLAGVDAVAVGKAALENAKRDAATPKAAPATKGGAAKRAARAV
ncbi:MAG: ParB/RepB/Spo0J family partition protein, partial [Thermoanaerobaculia bacterium]